VTDEVSQFDLAAMGFVYLRFITPLSMTAASFESTVVVFIVAVAYLNYFFVPPFFGDACAGKQRTRVLRDRGRKGIGKVRWPALPLREMGPDPSSLLAKVNRKSRGRGRGPPELPRAVAQRLQDTVAVYAALGGGWWSDDAPVTTGAAN